MHLVDVNGDRVRTYVRTCVRPRPTTKLRMCERCSNSADLASFRNLLVLEFVSGPGNVPNTEETGTTQEQDRDKCARETPDERKRRGIFYRAILLFMRA